MARIPVRRPMSTERELREWFRQASGLVLSRRARFDTEYSAAQTDSQRYALERVFPRELWELYGRVDEVLDMYLELKHSEQLQ